MINAGSFNHQIHSSSSEILLPRWASNANELPNSLFPALLASFIGVGMLQVAHADSDEVFFHNLFIFIAK